MAGNTTAPSETLTKFIRPSFPTAINNRELIKILTAALVSQNVTTHDVLLATSCCPDEINRDLDVTLYEAFGRPFVMGGLAGFPFVGKTGFGAYMHHVAKGGTMMVITAAHVGVHYQTGDIGKLRRIGMESDSSACGAAIGAYHYCSTHHVNLKKIAARDPNVYAGFNDELDSQQNYVMKTVAGRFDELSKNANPMIGLVDALARAVHDDFLKILPKKEDIHFNLVLLSGVQINWEASESDTDDYFQPISFEFIEHGTGKTTDLMSFFPK